MRQTPVENPWGCEMSLYKSTRGLQHAARVIFVPFTSPASHLAARTSYLLFVDFIMHFFRRQEGELGITLAKTKQVQDS